jgi:hypothetical protein
MSKPKRQQELAEIAREIESRRTVSYEHCAQERFAIAEVRPAAAENPRANFGN